MATRHRLTMRTPIHRRTLLQAAAASLAAPGFVRAADWPSRTLRIVIPFAGGGSSDIVARLLADKLAAALGQAVIVEAKPGANGILASEAVAHAGDGHTLLLVGAAHAINANLYPKLPDNPARDFLPVALVASPGPLVLGLHAGSAAALPVNTLPELVALARRQPGTVSYASAGVGNILHLAGEMLAQQAGVQLLHVPYKGAAPALNDLAGGQVQMMFNSALALAPFVKDGRVRLLAQTGARRSPALPADLPTVAEALQLPGYEVSGWFGLVAPANTPADAVARLNTECRRALAQPDLREKLTLLGSSEVPTQTAAEFGRFLGAEIERYARVVQVAGLKLDAPAR